MDRKKSIAWFWWKRISVRFQPISSMLLSWLIPVSWSRPVKSMSDWLWLWWQVSGFCLCLPVFVQIIKLIFFCFFESKRRRRRRRRRIGYGWCFKSSIRFTTTLVKAEWLWSQHFETRFENNYCVISWKKKSSSS